MPALSIRSVRSTALCTAGVAARSRSATLARVAILAGATLVALTVRVASLETYGFSEDEINKLENEALVSQLRVGGTPWREIRMADRLAAQVFRVAER